MFCPFNLLAFWNTFVLPLNCNNLTTIVRGILVLLSVITFYSLCMLNFKTIQSQFLCKHSLEFFFPVIPRLSFSLFYPVNSIDYFGNICLLILLVSPGHTLGLFRIYIFLGYHYLTFPFFLPPCRLFPLSCFV